MNTLVNHTKEAKHISIIFFIRQLLRISYEPYLKFDNTPRPETTFTRKENLVFTNI